jgi:hypothetical protein
MISMLMLHFKTYFMQKYTIWRVTGGCTLILWSWSNRACVALLNDMQLEECWSNVDGDW